MSYHPIAIQHMDATTEAWELWHNLHAVQVNKASGGETYSAGREQYRLRLTFDLRWCSTLEALRYAPQDYRIVYRGKTYNITDYDDYMEQRRMVRIVGELYG